MTLLGGSFEFLAAVIVILIGVVYTVYSQSVFGSGIDHHPFRRSNTDAPGAYGPGVSVISGRDGIVNTTSRGTK
jgi:hypothetical protein